MYQVHASTLYQVKCTCTYTGRKSIISEFKKNLKISVLKLMREKMLKQF